MTTLKSSRYLTIMLFLFSHYVSFAQDSGIAGTYTGILPCADCQGIQYRLTLNTDGNYNEVMIYKGKNTMPATSAGKYSVKNGSVTLEKSTPGMQYFKVIPYGLQMMDINGNIVEGATSNLYLLKNEGVPEQTNSGSQIQIEENLSKLNFKKYNEGIDFYASGNEPSWSIDIDFQKGMYFKTLNGRALNTPAVRGVKAMDANVVMYTSKTDTGTLQIQILQQDCIDKMSGSKSMYKASVEVQFADEQKSTTYEGCGHYIPDYRLNGGWILNTIGPNEKVNAKNYKNGLPQIEINVDEKSFQGNAGCNSISGKLHSEENRIRFMHAASTMMACNDSGKETAFIKALQSSINYKIVSNTLFLSNPDGIKLSFVKNKQDLKSKSDSAAQNSKRNRLNDIWVLESMNGVKTDAKNYMKGIPVLEFHIADMQYMGNTGCNSLNGKFEATDKTLKIYPGAMTRMHCETANEGEYLKALNNINGYEVENGKLMLMIDNKVVLIYKHVD